MKLAPLKLTNLNVINQEIDQFDDLMKNLLKDIKRNNEVELVPEYMKYRDIIGYRISELDDFIKLNKKDVRIPNFDRAKIRLKQIYNSKEYEAYLTDEVKEKYENQNISQRSNVKGNQVSSHSRKLSLPENEKSQVVSRNNGNSVLEKNKNRSMSTMGNNIKKNVDRLNSSMTSMAEPKSEKIEKNLNVRRSSAKYNSVDEELDISSGIFNKRPSLADFKSKPRKSQNQQALFNFDFGKETNCKEIVFKLKMTEEEYNILIKEKAKIK